MIKPKRLVNLLVASLFLAGLSITSVLLQGQRVYGVCEDSGCGAGDFGNAYQRPGISGIYRGVNVWGVLKIIDLNYKANPLTFSADDNNENEYFNHFTTGYLVSIRANELIWNITTRRRNTSDGCTTIMNGTLIQKSNNTARAVYTSTDGHCDLPMNFSSVTEFRKN